MADISVIKMPNNQSYNVKDATARQNINDLIKISDTQPSSTATKIWITETAPDPVQVPTVSEMNTAIATAIGEVNSFDIAIVQTLPIENIKEHTIYFVPKIGDTNDVYDEYVYINNTWEMIGNTQIDLSGKVDNEDFENLITNIAYQYEELTFPIAEGTLCFYNDELYSSKQTINTSEEWTPAHWNKMTIAQRLYSDYNNFAIYGQALTYKYTKPSSGIPASDLAADAIPVQDVQVNGTSVVSNGVANVPLATWEVPGVAKINADYGLYMTSTTGTAYCYKATSANIKEGTQYFRPIVPYNQHEATFYGLAKAAGQDMASSNNSIGTYTAAAATAIKTMLQVQEGLEVVKLI